MLFLHLIRHAKAEENTGQYKDYFRPLTSNGMMEAARIANQLKADGVKPDHIIASPAERTTRTAEIFADQLGFESEKIVYIEQLYDGRMQEYLNIINAIDNSHKNVLLIGHNPIISYMAEYLTGEELGDVPTSGVVSMTFEQDSWNLVSKKAGTMTKYQSPNRTLGY
jgi:phosphohistidine phosphatase